MTTLFSVTLFALFVFAISLVAEMAGEATARAARLAEKKEGK